MLQQRDEPRPEARGPDPGQQQRHAFVPRHERTEHLLCPVERLLHQPRRLGLVSDPEARVEIGLEWELTKERQTEGVDRRDLHVAQPVAQRGPAAAGGGRGRGRLAQLAQDPLAHLRRRFPSERHGENVRRIDPRAQQVQVS